MDSDGQDTCGRADATAEAAPGHVKAEAAPGHVAAVVGLARRAAPVEAETTVVAIDGLSGSGKTTLAIAVGRALRAPVLHMDEFCPGWDGLESAVALVTSTVLQPLSEGKDATYRRWDWVADDWGMTVALRWVPLLVLEGCGASADPAGRYAAVRVWVEAATDVRRRRALDRDGSAYQPHWQRWAQQEQRLFTRDRTRENAQLVIDTTRFDPDPDPDADPDAVSSIRPARSRRRTRHTHRPGSSSR